MAFTGSLEDRLLIRERFGAYSDAVFRQDVDAYLDCWSDEGVRVADGVEIRGKSALRAHWTGAWSGVKKLAFFAEIGAIEVVGDVARARCYGREILLTEAGVWKVVGVYDDQLVRQGEDWRFARREYQLFLSEPAPGAV